MISAALASVAGEGDGHGKAVARWSSREQVGGVELAAGVALCWWSVSEKKTRKRERKRVMHLVKCIS